MSFSAPTCDIIFISHKLKDIITSPFPNYSPFLSCYFDICSLSLSFDKNSKGLLLVIYHPEAKYESPNFLEITTTRDSHRVYIPYCKGFLFFETNSAISRALNYYPQELRVCSYNHRPAHLLINTVCVYRELPRIVKYPQIDYFSYRSLWLLISIRVYLFV